MDQSIGFNRMISFLFFVLLSSCDGWLDEYFKMGNHDIFKIEAVKKLRECSLEAERWEESVRLRKMNETLCSLNKEMERCAYSSYQDAVGEYIKHLLIDSKRLCGASCWDAVEKQIEQLTEQSNNCCQGKNDLLWLLFALVMVAILGGVGGNIAVWMECQKQKIYVPRGLTRDEGDRLNVGEDEGIDIIEYPLRRD